MLTLRDQKAHDAQVRAIGVFAKRPEAAQAKFFGTAEVGDGLSCVYEQDGHAVSVDMADAVGGDNTGPSPGYYGRAAICSCLAIGIKMAATREGISLNSVRIEIVQDLDNRGVMAVPGTCATPIKTDVTIAINSPEPQDVVEDVVNRALACDPWYLAFRDAQEIATSTIVSKSSD